MSNPIYDAIAELADQANDHNKQIGIEERVDIVYGTEHEFEVAAKRKLIHDMVDKMLDMLDADGGDQADIVIEITSHKFDDSDHDLQETVGKYVVEFASDAVEEVHVDFINYLAGKKVSTTHREVNLTE